jgi:Beta-galactosidase trimerisation domain/Beta-galactosidase
VENSMSLNRRHFIGGMIAAVSTPRLAAGEANTTAPAQVRLGDWVGRGLVDAGGSHEPYLFVVRRGGQRLDARQMADYQQSEELIRELRSQGVEVFHTHLYKGFGMEAELEGMEETRKATEIAHRLGMKVDTYLQWNTLMYETFFVEEPRAVHWVQRDAAGLPILLPYGFQQSYRYRPCFANQEYLDYLKKIVRYAVIEVKTDFIHFDNFDLNTEPDSCHCAACVSGFRTHLKKKYTAAQLKERFGFECVDYVNPPQWNSENPPSKMKIIYDPALQEWIDFRCQLMSDALKQMYDLVRSLNAEVALEINPAGITGQNRSWASGIDHARLLKFTQSFWSEEGNPPGLEGDGRLVTRIRSYKLARAYSNVVLMYVADNELALAETLAFNQTLGYLGVGPLSAMTKEHIDFYDHNRDCYEGSKDAADIGIFRSFASLSYNNADVQLSTVLMEQALIQACVPFNLVFDEGLHDLAQYRVLILPNTECLSDAQISLLRKYVEQGGSLVVTGQAGLYDEWRRVRVTPGLQGLVDNQAAGADYREHIEDAAVPVGDSSRKTVGRGRVAYLPKIEFDGELPPATPNFAITNQFWKRPKNWKELVDLVQWAAGDQLLLSADGPDGLVVNCTTQPSRRRMFVHLLNYNAVAAPTLHGIRVSVLLPGNAKASGVTARITSTTGAREIDFKQEDARTSFVLPDLHTYALITVTW